MTLRPPVPTSDKLPKDDVRKQHRAAMIPVIVGLVIVLGLAGLSAINRKPKITTIAFHTGDLSSVETADDSGLGLRHGGVDAGISPFSPPSSVDETLMVRSGDSDLQSDPADLPSPGQGERIGAFIRNEGNITDEYAFWLIKSTSIDTIMTFYTKAAQDLEFKLLPDQKIKHQASITQPLSVKSTATTDVKSDSKADVKLLDSNKAGVKEDGGKLDATDQAVAQPQVRTLIFTRSHRPDMEKNETLPAGNDVLIVRAKPTAQGQVHVTLWYRHATVVLQ